MKKSFFSLILFSTTFFTYASAACAGVTVKLDTWNPINVSQHVIAGDNTDVSAFQVKSKQATCSYNLHTLWVEVLNGWTSNAMSAISEVALFDSNGNQIASAAYGTAFVLFENLNYFVSSGTVLYVRMYTNPIGLNQNGAVAENLRTKLHVIDYEDVVTATTFPPIAAVAYSPVFDIVPVAVDEISFVQSYGPYNLPLTYSQWAERPLTIVKISTDTRSNTNTCNGSDLDLVLNNMNILVQRSPSRINLTNFEIVRIDLSAITSSWAALDLKATGTYNPVTQRLRVNFNTADPEFAHIGSDTDAYYLIGANIAWGTSWATINFSIDGLDTLSNQRGIKYAASDCTRSSPVQKTWLWYTTVDGPVLSWDNN